MEMDSLKDKMNGNNAIDLSALEKDTPFSLKQHSSSFHEMHLLLENQSITTEEKVREIFTKCLFQSPEIKQLEKELATMKQKYNTSVKEKEALNAELNKGMAIRQKLEAVCRELQRQNKTVLEESKRIATEEQEKRQELSTKFHDTTTVISRKLEEQGEERMRQIKENETLREKLKHFSQQYELREQHFTHQLRTKTLEIQLMDAKFKQQQELSAQEEAKAKLYAEQISQLLKTEAELRSQLSMYSDKFEQFQDTLTKSNEVFTKFKQEVDKMSKTIKLLEKENASLRSKCEKSDISIIELLDDQITLKKHLETTKSQKEKLESLCRTLQTERKALKEKGNQNGKEQSDSTSLPNG